MDFNLLTALPTLLPKAIAWAEEQSAYIAKNGSPLNDLQTRIATSVGVRSPEKIRILGVSSMPIPKDVQLKQAAIEVGLLGPRSIGLTLDHGVYICKGHKNNRLLSHEFRHIYQYEEAGSIAIFLTEYLNQVASVGYFNAPYEVDARAHEQESG